MLENILNSKLKKKLLRIFFSFPQRAFSVQELRTMAEGSLSAILDAIRELSQAGVANVSRRKNQRFFRINDRFVLYDEVKDLLEEEESAGDDLVGKTLKKLPNIKLAILSGIFTARPELPVDIFLVGDGLNHLRVERLLADIHKLTGQEINYAVFDRKEFEHRQLLNDRFIRDVLDYPHIVVVNSMRK